MSRRKRTRIPCEWTVDDPTRTNRAASLIVWHLPELACVLVPAGFALAVSAWAWLVSGVIAAGWMAREMLVALQQAAIRNCHDLSPAHGAADAPSCDSDVDTSDPVDGSRVNQVPADDAAAVSL